MSKTAAISKPTVVVGLSSRANLSRLAGFIMEEQGRDVRYLHLELAPKVKSALGLGDAAFRPEAWAASTGKSFQRLDLSKESEAWFDAQVLRFLGQFWCPDLRGSFDSGFLVPRLQAWARAHGIENVSTGHRARVVTEGQDISLWRSRDVEHDQSAWLAQAGRKFFRSLELPLGYLKQVEIERLCHTHEIGDPKGSLAGEAERLAPLEGIRSLVDTKSLSRVKQKGWVIDEKQQALAEHAGLLDFHPGSKYRDRVALGCDLMKQWLVVGPAEKLERSKAFLTARADWCSSRPNLAASIENLEIDLGFRDLVRSRASVRLLTDSMLRVEKISEKDALPFATGRRVTFYRGAVCLGSAQVLESYF